MIGVVKLDKQLLMLLWQHERKPTNLLGVVLDERVNNGQKLFFDPNSFVRAKQLGRKIKIAGELSGLVKVCYLQPERLIGFKVAGVYPIC